MKLLFIRDFFDYGGASKMIVSVANAMVEYGHEVAVYAYGSSERPQMVADDVTFIPGTPYIKNRILRHPAKIKEIRKAIKNYNPDMLVTFMPYPSILTSIAKLGLHKKIVVSERGDPAIYGGFIKLFGHKIIARADGAVFQTEGARAFYGSKFYQKSVVIPNAITVSKAERLSLEQRSNEIAFVGRFENRQKRQDLMVGAFSRIADKYPDVNLVFYGDGQDQSMIENMVEEKGLSNRVRFAGSVTPIETYIRNARMYVLTSDYEGIPNSLIEAMCVGLPCVATDCTPGGARFLIEDGVNGRLVPKGDIEAIVCACEEILSHPEDGELFGIEAQKICDKYAPGKIYKKWNEYLLHINSKDGDLLC